MLSVSPWDAFEVFLGKSEVLGVVIAIAIEKEDFAFIVMVMTIIVGFCSEKVGWVVIVVVVDWFLQLGRFGNLLEEKEAQLSHGRSRHLRGESVIGSRFTFFCRFSSDRQGRSSSLRLLGCFGKCSFGLLLLSIIQVAWLSALSESLSLVVKKKKSNEMMLLWLCWVWSYEVVHGFSRLDGVLHSRYSCSCSLQAFLQLLELLSIGMLQGSTREHTLK